MCFKKGEKINSFFIIREIKYGYDKTYGDVVKMFLMSDGNVLHPAVLFYPIKDFDMRKLEGMMVQVNGYVGEHGKIMASNIRPAFIALKDFKVEPITKITAEEILYDFKKTLNKFDSCAIADVLFTLLKLHQDDLLKNKNECILHGYKYEYELYATYSLIKAFEDFSKAHTHIDFEALFTLCVLNLLEPIREDTKGLSEELFSFLNVHSTIFLAVLFKDDLKDLTRCD